VNADLKRETDRLAARRRKAIADGRNPALVTGEIQPRVRITIPSARVPSIPRNLCEGQAGLFFSDRPDDIAAAVLICQGCAGRSECLAGAMARREMFGVWGGADFDRSHKVRRKETAA
jgi:hypothetical protein